MHVCPAGATKAWGEVSPASGGVIIPYLGTIDLKGILPGQGVSFGYSDCLKWGYQGSLTVVYFNVTQAVGILGLDLTRVRGTIGGGRPPASESCRRQWEGRGWMTDNACFGATVSLVQRMT